MMEFYVYNQSLERVAIIDKFSSVIWTTKYNDVGDFEIYFPATETLLAAIKENYIITRTDSDRAMIIKTIKIQADEENGDFATISGLSLESILDQRIIWYQTTLSGRVEDCINQLVSTNCIDTETDRIVPGLRLGEYQGFSDILKGQYEAASLLATVGQICKNYSLGFKTTFDFGDIIFSLYKGVDRSYSQSINPWVVFSADFDNLLQSDYSHDLSQYRNVALIGGEGDGTAKKYATVQYYSGSGIGRYEMYVDGKGVSSNSGEISSGDYELLLMQKGIDELVLHSVSETIEASVNADGYKYGTDYNLGDIIQITTKHGLQLQPRIMSITENEDENGYKLYPTWEVN